MSTVVRGGLAALLLIAWTGGTAMADDPEGDLSVWFRPGWQYADLGTANDLIDHGNAVFSRFEYSSMDAFHNTFYVGAEVQLNVHRRITAYGGYGYVFGSQSMSFNRVIRTEISGSPITAGAMYRVPWPGRWETPLADLDLFAGGGIVYMSNFEFTASDENLTTNLEFLEERMFKGDGLGFELRLNLEYFLSPSFTLTGGASYRVLTLNDLEHSVSVDNPNAYNPTGDEDGDGVLNRFDPDYDGVAGEFGQVNGNTQVLYGLINEDQEWARRDNRYLESLYKYDPAAYAGMPASFQVYDPGASFDLDLSGIQVQLGITFYVF